MKRRGEKRYNASMNQQGKIIAFCLLLISSHKNEINEIILLVTSIDISMFLFSLFRLLIQEI